MAYFLAFNFGIARIARVEGSGRWFILFRDGQVRYFKV
jgi:hypothetical protein